MTNIIQMEKIHFVFDKKLNKGQNKQRCLGPLNIAWPMIFDYHWGLSVCRRGALTGWTPTLMKDVNQIIWVQSLYLCSDAKSLSLDALCLILAHSWTIWKSSNLKGDLDCIMDVLFAAL